MIKIEKYKQIINIIANSKENNRQELLDFLNGELCLLDRKRQTNKALEQKKSDEIRTSITEGVLDFLRSNPDDEFTIDEIIDGISGRVSTTHAKAAYYLNMMNMEDLIRKGHKNVDDKRKVSYFISSEEEEIRNGR